MLYLKNLKSSIKKLEESACGPVAKTLCPQRRGPRFDPWSGNQNPQATTTHSLHAATNERRNRGLQLNPVHSREREQKDERNQKKSRLSPNPAEGRKEIIRLNSSQDKQHSKQRHRTIKTTSWFFEKINKIDKLSLVCCCSVAPVVSDSVRPHRRQPTRRPRPWGSSLDYRKRWGNVNNQSQMKARTFLPTLHRLKNLQENTTNNCMPTKQIIQTKKKNFQKYTNNQN